MSNNPAIAGPLTTVDQERAIALHVAAYDEAGHGLHSYTAYHARDEHESYPATAVAVDFRYIREDGSLGSTVIVFADDGTALD